METIVSFVLFFACALAWMVMPARGVEAIEKSRSFEGVPVSA